MQILYRIVTECYLIVNKLTLHAGFLKLFLCCIVVAKTAFERSLELLINKSLHYILVNICGRTRRNDPSFVV